VTRIGWLVVAALAVVGCGKSDPAADATVRGRVLFQGRPLAGGVVVFAPDREKGSTGKPLSATIDAEGRYQLTPLGGAIPPGWYRVALAEAPDGFGEVRFPAALRRPDRSGLEREVLAGKDNVFHFEIELVE
jgi:hypothetical protein